MIPKQEEVAEKLIHHLQTTKKKESIFVSVSRIFTQAEINEVNFGSQLLPFLEDTYQLIRKVGKSQLYELTEAGVDFISFDELRRKEEEEKKRIEDSHLLTKEQLKDIKESRVISARAEERAVKAEKRAKTSLRVAIICGACSILLGGLTLWFSLKGWI